MKKYILSLCNNIIFLFVLSIVGLSGCNNAYFYKADNNPNVDENSYAGNGGIHVPLKGEQVMIYDPVTNQTKTVVFGDVYTAASGHKCSLYYPAGTDLLRNAEGVTCHDGNGNWIEIPLKLNIKGSIYQ